MSNKQKLDLITLIILIGFGVAVAYHYVMGVYLGLPYPYNSFLFWPNGHFQDFFNSIKWTDYVTAGTDVAMGYPPFSLVIIFLFKSIQPKDTSFFFFVEIFIAFVLWFCYKNLNFLDKLSRWKNVFIIGFISFPVLFTIDRGNWEVFVFIFLGLFVYFYARQKTLFASIFLAMAIAAKIYPLFFILIFLADRKYKETALTILGALALTFVPLLFFHGSVAQNLSILKTNVGLYYEQYALDNSGLNYGTSLFGFIKTGLLAYTVKIGFDKPYFMRIVHTIAPWYSVFVLACYALLAFFVLFIEKAFWRKILLITVAGLLLPQVTADYRLIHLLIPMLLFINYDRQFSKIDALLSVVFGLLLIPKNYLLLNSAAEFVSGRPVSPFLYDGIVIDPILLIILAAITVVCGWREYRPGAAKQKFAEYNNDIKKFFRLV